MSFKCLALLLALIGADMIVSIEVAPAAPSGWVKK
jgi:hypothetical protein